MDAPPLPPNRTGGFPASGSPVNESPLWGRLIASWNHGGKKVGSRCPRDREHPVPRMASRQLAPITTALWVALPRFSLAAISEVLSWWVSSVFIFLRPFAPPALPGFFATTNALTAPGPSLPLPGRSLHLTRDSFGSFPLHPHRHRPTSSIGNPCTGADSPLSRQASPLASKLARCPCRIEFTFVRDQSSVSSCSPPRLATTQLLSTAHRSLPPVW